MMKYELGKAVRWFFVLSFILLLAIRCITVYFVDSFDYSNPADELYDEYIDILEGGLTVEKEEYILNEWTMINENISRSEEMELLYIGGEISRDEYAHFNDTYMYAQSHISSINKVMEDYTYIKAFCGKTDTVIMPEFINSRYWNCFFDPASVGWIPILLIIIISIYIFSVEQSTGMWNIINAAYNGKAKILKTKMAVSALIGGVISFTFAIAEYQTYLCFFDMHQIDAPIQSLHMFGDITVSISIGEAAVLLVLWRTMAGIGISLISLLAAALIRKDMLAVVLMLAAVFAPVLVLDALPEAFTYSLCGLYNGIAPLLAFLDGDLFAGAGALLIMPAIIAACIIFYMYRLGYKLKK